MRVAVALVALGVLAMWWIKRSPRTADPAPRWKPADRTINNNRSKR